MGLSETRLVEKIASKNNEIYYLKSIFRQYLNLFDIYTEMNPDVYTMVSAVAYDNLNWLSVYIECKETELKKLETQNENKVEIR